MIETFVYSNWGGYKRPDRAPTKGFRVKSGVWPAFRKSSSREPTGSEGQIQAILELTDQVKAFKASVMRR